MERHKDTGENCQKKQRAVQQYCCHLDTAHTWRNPKKQEAFLQCSPSGVLIPIYSYSLLFTSAETGGSNGIILMFN